MKQRANGECKSVDGREAEKEDVAERNERNVEAGRCERNVGAERYVRRKTAGNF